MRNSTSFELQNPSRGDLYARKKLGKIYIGLLRVHVCTCTYENSPKTRKFAICILLCIYFHQIWHGVRLVDIINYTNLMPIDSRVLILQGSDDDDDDDDDDEGSSLFAVSISTLCYATALPMIKTRAGETAPFTRSSAIADKPRDAIIVFVILPVVNSSS